MRNILLVGLSTAMIAGCTTSPSASDTQVADAKIQQMVAGKVASAPMSCIPEYQSSTSSTVGSHAIAFDVNPALVYLSDTTGTGCEGLSDPTNSLIIKSRGPTGLCSGDQVQVRNLHTGIMVGACTLGDFVRYTRA